MKDHKRQAPQIFARPAQKQRIFKISIGVLIYAFLMMVLAPTGTTYIVNNTLDSGAGSLREAITAANLSADAPTISFDIPTSDPNYDALSGVWTITLASALPQITKDEMQILGFTQTANQGDLNPGLIGTGGTVGVDSISLPQYSRTEIAIDGGGASAVISVGGSACDLLIEGLTIYNGGTAISLGGGVGVNRIIRNCILGVLADGTDPGIAARVVNYGVLQSSGGVAQVDSCYIGLIGRGGFVGVANDSEVHASYNEFFDIGWNSNSHDALDLNGINGSARYNLVRNTTTSSLSRNGGGGHGIELGSQTAGTGNNIIENNTSHSNISAGIVIRKGASYNIIRKNLFYDNEVGILGNEEGRQTIGNQIRQNLMFNNAGLSIDITHVDSSAYDQVTPNDGALNGTAFNEGMDYPVITGASLSGSVLTVSGYVGTSSTRITGVSTLDFFKAEDDLNNAGEIEYGDGQSISHGEARYYIDSCYTDAAGNFSCALSVPGGLSLSDGDFILATATCSTNSSSELGNAFELNSGLPVDLTSFLVEAEGQSALLSWTTASEQNSAYFQVERSVDAKAYIKVGLIEAAGRSTDIREYQFNDKSVINLSDHQVYYRLKQVDKGGNYRFSTVEIYTPITSAVFKIQLKENPIREYIRLQHSSPNAEILTISILNIAGQTVFVEQIKSSTEERELSIAVSGWARGIYTMQVFNGMQSRTQKLVLP